MNKNNDIERYNQFAEKRRKEFDTMKTNMELRIYIDMDVILETEFSEQQIVEMIKGISFNDFKYNEFNVVELDDGSEVTVFPHFNIYNDLILTVSNF